MRRLIFLAAAVLLAAAPALATEAPYAKLGVILGTPKLAYSFGPKDKSQLLLKFVPTGQDDKAWTKMTTVSILKIPAKDTEVAGRGVITKLHDELKKRQVKIESFEVSPPASPATCYFEYSGEGEHQKGVIYSPTPGFVTVAQVGAKSTKSITPHDIAVLKSLIHQ
jgi:hypothetical protein